MNWGTRKNKSPIIRILFRRVPISRRLLFNHKIGFFFFLNKRKKPIFTELLFL